jgi:bacillithiol biosynthesis deacetylase BshB1
MPALTALARSIQKSFIQSLLNLASARRRLDEADGGLWYPVLVMADEQTSQLDVLAIAAHPDDVELCVGGTLIKLAKMGYRTGILDMTRGESGTRGTPELRAEEARRAAQILGVAVRENLDLGDAHVWVNEESRVKLVRVLRRLRPRVLFSQYKDDPHPDHAHTAQLVREAAHVAGLKKYDADAGLERWRPNCVAYFLFPRTLAPTFIVDVSEESERKWEAIRAHATQFFNPDSTESQSRVSTESFLQEVEARDRYFGAMIDTARGEAFFVREALNVVDPVALLTQPMNIYS